MAKTYTTIHGDLFDGIAYKTMGDCSYTAALLNLNPQYSSTYIFDAGVVLVLPDEEIREAALLPPWKRKGSKT